MLCVLSTQREGRGSDLGGVVHIRRYLSQNLCCHESRRPLDSGVRDVVDVTVQVGVLREILVMIPAQTGVGGTIAKRMIEKPDSSGHESVEPAVLHLSVELDVTRIAGGGSTAAPPIERKLGIHVVADREVVAEIVDVAPIRWA